jgi:anthranilate/para-aminobenzoate synthase component II
MILIVDNTCSNKKDKIKPLLTTLEDMKTDFKSDDSIDGISSILSKYKRNIKGIILSGGPICNTLSIKDPSVLLKNLLPLQECPHVPVLGICFGFQVLFSSLFDLPVHHARKSIGGKTHLIKQNESFLTEGLPTSHNVFNAHTDYLDPKDIKSHTLKLVLLYSKQNKIYGLQDTNNQYFGFQFHPEKYKQTTSIIRNFITYCYSS